MSNLTPIPLKMDAVLETLEGGGKFTLPWYLYLRFLSNNGIGGVQVFDSKSGFPIQGEDNTLYISADTQFGYFWYLGSYVQLFGSGTGPLSVGLADGSTIPIYNITGSPVTGTGTLTETLKKQVRGTFFAGPVSGADDEPTFREITDLDLPGSVCPTCDPHWSGEVVALLHFDGLDGSTTFTDEKGHTFTVEGNAKLSTSNVLYGTACGVFDGNGDDIYCVSSDFDLGTGDFTIEGFIRTVNNAAFDQGIFALTKPAGPDPFLALKMIGGNGLNLTITTAASITTRIELIVPGYYYHVAIVKIGAQTTLFVGGKKEAGFVLSSYDLATATQMSLGGCKDVLAGTSYWNGNLDEWRVTKGVGRYTDDFTPPPCAFTSMNC